MSVPGEKGHADKIPYELKIFEYLIENAFDMVQILDPWGCTVFVSPSVQRVLGHPPATIIGTDPIERVHPDDQETIRGLIEEMKGRPGEISRKIVVRGRHADGTWRTIECVIQNLIDDEAVGGLVANYRDITNETDARAQLSALKERYEKAFRNIPDSVTISYIDDGCFLEVNESFERLTGYTSDEIVGKSAVDVRIWKNPGTRRRVVEQIEEKGRVRDLEAEFVTRSGTVRWGLYAAEVIEINGRNCLLAVTRDITDKKDWETRLRETSEQLRREHADATRKNVALNEVLEHLEQEKSAFRHELSANVENLLRPIVEKLRSQDGRLAPQEVELLRDGLDAIVGHDLDRYQNNLTKLTPREMDISELIRLGRTSKEIADELSLSDQTVHKHRQAIRRKLQLDNRGINLAAYLRAR